MSSHIRRISTMSAFLITVTLISSCIDSARAATASDVQVVRTDHNWTVHFGDRYYGVSGNNAVTLPGILTQYETRIHLGRRMYSLFIPFYRVIGIGFGCLFLGAVAVDIKDRLFIMPNRKSVLKHT